MQFLHVFATPCWLNTATSHRRSESPLAPADAEPPVIPGEGRICAMAGRTLAGVLLLGSLCVLLRRGIASGSCTARKHVQFWGRPQKRKMLHEDV